MKGYGSSDNPKGFYLDKFLDELPFEVGGEPGWFIRPVEEGFLIWNSLESPDEKVYSKTQFWRALKNISSAYIENFPEEETSIWSTLKIKGKDCPHDLTNTFNQAQTTSPQSDRPSTSHI